MLPSKALRQPLTAQRHTLPPPPTLNTNDRSREAPAAVRSVGSRYYSSYTNFALALRSWTYACIDKRAEEASKSIFTVVRDDTTWGQSEHEEVGSDHWLVQLFKRPNPLMSWRELLYLSTMLCDANGNAYIYTPCGENGESPVPTSMWLMPSVGMQIVTGDGGGSSGGRAGGGTGGSNRNRSLSNAPLIRGYIYSGVGGYAVYEPHEVLHIKHPYVWSDPQKMYFVGRSKIEAAIEAIEIDHQNQAFLAGFFRNGTMPALAITSPNRMEQDQWELFLARYHESYHGAANAGKMIFLPENMDIKGISSGGREKELTDIDEANRKRLCAVFGTPEPVLTQLHQNKASAEVTQEAFQLGTINSLKTQFAEGMALHFGYYERGIDLVPNLYKSKGSEFELLERRFRIEIGEPRNSILAEMGRDPVEGGDVPMVLEGSIPLAMAIQGGGATAPTGAPVPPGAPAGAPGAPATATTGATTPPDSSATPAIPTPPATVVPTVEGGDETGAGATLPSISAPGSQSAESTSETALPPVRVPKRAHLNGASH